jgi:hypothetical protein
MIPEDLKIRATRRANATGLSLGGFIRESLEKALNSNDTDISDDPFLNDHAVFEGDTEPDLAKKHDDYLYGEKV